MNQELWASVAKYAIVCLTIVASLWIFHKDKEAVVGIEEEEEEEASK